MCTCLWSYLSISESPLEKAIHGDLPLIQSNPGLLCRRCSHPHYLGLHIQSACMCDHNCCVFRFMVSNEEFHIWGKLWSEHRGQLSPKAKRRWKRGKMSARVQWGGGHLWGFVDQHLNYNNILPLVEYGSISSSEKPSENHYLVS